MCTNIAHREAELSFDEVIIRISAMLGITSASSQG